MDSDVFSDAKRFLLSAHCPACNKSIDADLTLLGGGEQGLRSASLLCRTREVRVGWTAWSTPMFFHRSCGSLLTPGSARPILAEAEATTGHDRLNGGMVHSQP